MNWVDLQEVLEVLERDKRIYNVLKDCPYEILKTMKLRKYEESRFILEQGEVYDTLYIVVDGYADIIVESSQGKKYYLSTYGKGRVIGEMEMCDHLPYMSRVEAKGALAVLEISRDNYLKWLELDRNFSSYVLRTLCKWSYNSMTRMGNNTLYSLKQRICEFLIENTNDRGTSSMALSADLLSERMAVTTRSVNRVLKELKDRGLLEIKKSNIIIKDYGALLKEI